MKIEDALSQKFGGKWCFDPHGKQYFSLDHPFQVRFDYGKLIRTDTRQIVVL